MKDEQYGGNYWSEVLLKHVRHGANIRVISQEVSKDSFCGEREEEGAERKGHQKHVVIAMD